MTVFYSVTCNHEGWWILCKVNLFLDLCRFALPFNSFITVTCSVTMTAVRAGKEVKVSHCESFPGNFNDTMFPTLSRLLVDYVASCRVAPFPSHRRVYFQPCLLCLNSLPSYFGTVTVVSLKRRLWTRARVHNIQRTNKESRCLLWPGTWFHFCCGLSAKLAGNNVGNDYEN
jgi:hypothetical protein